MDRQVRQFPIDFVLRELMQSHQHQSQPWPCLPVLKKQWPTQSLRLEELLSGPGAPQPRKLLPPLAPHACWNRDGSWGNASIGFKVQSALAPQACVQLIPRHPRCACDVPQGIHNPIFHGPEAAYVEVGV